MDRRLFLERLSCAVPGLVLMHAAGVQASPTSLSSLSVVTDDVTGALDSVRTAQPFGRARVRINERVLPGVQRGDVVVMAGGTLVNPWEWAGEWAGVRRVARTLNLPRTLTDAHLVTFETMSADHPRRAVADVVHRGVLVAQLPLDTDAEFTVAGQQGPLRVVVHQGTARVAEAGCRHQTCVLRGGVSRHGEAAVCVPERLAVTVSGGAKRGVDRVSR